MESRETVLFRLDRDLGRWRMEIVRLRQRARNAAPDRGKQIHAAVDDRDRRQADIEKKVEELRYSADDTWDDFKAGVERETRDLAEAFRTAANRLSP